jgi:hypothetical protein
MCEAGELHIWKSETGRPKNRRMGEEEKGKWEEDEEKRKSYRN